MPIRTSTSFPFLAVSMTVCLGGAALSACAKGTEISPSEIVYLEPLPEDRPDASADAAVPPSEPEPDGAAPGPAGLAPAAPASPGEP